MKKMLASLGALTLSAGAITPFINFSISLYDKEETITSNHSYTFNFASFDWGSISFADVNGISQATLTSSAFTTALQDCVQEMFDQIDPSISNVFDVTQLMTTYAASGNNNGNVTDFNAKFKAANQDLVTMNITNHRAIIERYKDPYSGYLYYVNVVATIGGTDIRLYGSNSFRPFSSISAMQVKFTNTFRLSITREVWIQGEDSSVSGFELTQNMPHLYKDMIFEWLERPDQERLKNDVIKYINSTMKVAITKIDVPTKVYYAITTDSEKYAVGSEIPDGTRVTDPYFYIGFTSDKEAYGEYKVLFKNSLGKD